ncbi:MAG: RsmD family RNA methyltransferase, partial [Bacteroidetes bacterium]|nr:RsmD family RNA methyltransferase [Bacteroidota bacterium]
PKNLPVRPTTDFSKEALFNLLNNKFDFTKCNVVDLYSGTGNIAYEFASRSCKRITAVDFNQKCVGYISKTCKELNINNIKIIKADVYRYVARCTDKFDIIYADPPYDAEDVEKVLDQILASDLLNKNGYLILEHSKRNDYSKKEQFLEQRKYGDVRISIFSA